MEGILRPEEFGMVGKLVYQHLDALLVSRFCVAVDGGYLLRLGAVELLERSQVGVEAGRPPCVALDAVFDISLFLFELVRIGHKLAKREKVS